VIRPVGRAERSGYGSTTQTCEFEGVMDLYVFTKEEGMWGETQGLKGGGQQEKKKWHDKPSPVTARSM
jgi:hypothetical protein